MKTCNAHPYAPVGELGCVMCNALKKPKPRFNDRQVLEQRWAQKRLERDLAYPVGSSKLVERLNIEDELNDVSGLVDPTWRE